jgi:hypothetical protein
MSLPTAAGLVLRDRTNSDPLQVLTVAIDELVAAGVWVAGRRGLRRRMTLAPAAPEAPELVEPLRCTDALLRRAAAELGAPLTVVDAARRAAVHDRGVAALLPRRTIEDLVARGWLSRPELTRVVEGVEVVMPRLSLTARGSQQLAVAPPTAEDPDERAAGLRALSRRGRVFVKAWTATPIVGNGFPAGSVGAGLPSEVPDNGSNTEAAIWTGTLTR